MKIIDATNPGNAPESSMFLHGLTGHGKSHWTTAGGVPLVVLFEAKAQAVLLQINPKAVGIVPESLDDLDTLMVFLGQPDKLAAKGIDRIILDSFTELTQALPRWIKQKMGPVGTLVKLEQSEFGSLQDYALAVVKAIQYTGYPSVIIGRSVSKRVGLVECIKPDSLGKSVDQLPGKLLPTAEARFDPELGYVIDTTPADHSQRCGLPWLPSIWSGNCLDYLRLVKGGSQSNAPAAVETSTPPAPALDKEWTTALVQFNEATFKANWTAAERKKASDAWEAKGSAALTQLVEATKNVKPKEETKPKHAQGPTSADLPEATPPGTNDPVWISLMSRLAEATKTRPEQERSNQVAAWRRAYVTNPVKAKLDLGDFLAATERLLAEGGPDPEKDPEGYRKAFSAVCTVLQAEKRAKDAAPQTPSAAAAFAAGVAAGPGTAKQEDIRELLDLSRELKIDLDSLWAYAKEKGGARETTDHSKDWHTITADFLGRVVPQLKDPQKRVGVISWLHKKYQKVPF